MGSPGILDDEPLWPERVRPKGSYEEPCDVLRGLAACNPSHAFRALESMSCTVIAIRGHRMLRMGAGSRWGVSLVCVAPFVEDRSPPRDKSSINA